MIIGRFSTCLLAFLGIFLVMGPAATPTVAQEAWRGVTVQGSGKMEVAPDLVVLRFGVVTTHEDPEEARELNADASSEAMNVVRSIGVAEEDIQVEGLHLQPLREYNPDTRQWTENGFEATRNVKVTIRDLTDLPEIVAAVVEHGANRISGIQYMLDDRKATEREALRLAVRDAREKAAVMVDELGMSLGPVMRISEQGVSIPEPMMRMESMQMAKDQAGGDPEAYAAGTIEVTAAVTVTFYLTR